MLNDGEFVYEVEWFTQTYKKWTDVFGVERQQPYLFAHKEEHPTSVKAHSHYRDICEDPQGRFDPAAYKLTRNGTSYRRESLFHEGERTPEETAYALERIAELRAILHPARSLDGSDERPPRSKADVMRAATSPPPARVPKVTEPAPWVVAAGDPESVWSIPDDVIDAYAQEADAVHPEHVEPDYEPDAWKQRKDMQ